MPVRVVDASALGALIYGEPKAEEIARALTDSTIVAPALLWFELASVTLKNLRVPRIRPHFVKRLRKYQGLGIIC